MSRIDQKICAWGGPFCAATNGAGLIMAGFLPPPSPSLSATEIAALYTANAPWIRAGMILTLLGIVGFCSMIAVVSTQMRRMLLDNRLPVYMQLGAGSIGVLTVMFPTMIFAIAAFRPERDPALTQLLNDLGWLIIIPAFPTFLAQYGAIAMGILADRRPVPVYPRWVAYLNIWIALLFVPGAFAFIFKHGPFAWNGILSFWVAASAFFTWLVVMTPLTIKAINRTYDDERVVPLR